MKIVDITNISKDRVLIEGNEFSAYYRYSNGEWTERNAGKGMNDIYVEDDLAKELEQAWNDYWNTMGTYS